MYKILRMLYNKSQKVAVGGELLFPSKADLVNYVAMMVAIPTPDDDVFYHNVCRYFNEVRFNESLMSNTLVTLLDEDNNMLEIESFEDSLREVFSKTKTIATKYREITYINNGVKTAHFWKREAVRKELGDSLVEFEITQIIQAKNKTDAEEEKSEKPVYIKKLSEYDIKSHKEEILEVQHTVPVKISRHNNGFRRTKTRSRSPYCSWKSQSKAYKSWRKKCNRMRGRVYPLLPDLSEDILEDDDD